MLLLLRPAAARCEVRGLAKQAALKDQRYRTPLAFLAPIPRACEGRAEPATSVRGATHIQGGQQRDLGQQSDPPAPPGRRLAAVASSF